MADKGFDFKELSDCKLPIYKKKYCKSAVVKKAKGAIIMLDYRLAGKKYRVSWLLLKNLPKLLRHSRT